VKTLEEAVEKMAYLQLGKKLEKPQVDSIVAFLKTLSDKERVQ
jgi:cytochrome c peroxidase